MDTKGGNLQKKLDNTLSETNGSGSVVIKIKTTSKNQDSLMEQQKEMAKILHENAQKKAKTVANTVGTGMNTAGKTMQAAGNTAQQIGKGVGAIGKGMSKVANALNKTKYGAVVGVPLRILSTSAEAAGKTTQEVGSGLNQNGKTLSEAGSNIKQRTDELSPSSTNNAKSSGMTSLVPLNFPKPKTTEENPNEEENSSEEENPNKAIEKVNEKIARKNLEQQEQEAQTAQENETNPEADIAKKAAKKAAMKGANSVASLLSGAIGSSGVGLIISFFVWFFQLVWANLEMFVGGKTPLIDPLSYQPIPLLDKIDKKKNFYKIFIIAADIAFVILLLVAVLNIILMFLLTNPLGWALLVSAFGASAIEQFKLF